MEEAPTVPTEKQLLQNLSSGNGGKRITAACKLLLYENNEGIPLLIKELERDIEAKVVLYKPEGAGWRPLKHILSFYVWREIEDADDLKALKTWWAKNHHKPREQWVEENTERLISKLQEDYNSNKGFTRALLFMVYYDHRINDPARFHDFYKWWSPNKEKSRAQVFRERIPNLISRLTSPDLETRVTADREFYLITGQPQAICTQFGEAAWKFKGPTHKANQVDWKGLQKARAKWWNEQKHAWEFKPHSLVIF